MQAALRSLLGGGTSMAPLPGLAGWDLLGLEGGASDELLPTIRQAPPDVLVLCGLHQTPAPVWPAQLGELPRIVVWPLMGDDPLLELPGYRDFLDLADVICTVSPAEHRRVSQLPWLNHRPAIENVPVAFSVDRAAAAHRVPGLTSLTGSARRSLTSRRSVSASPAWRSPTSRARGGGSSGRAGTGPFPTLPHGQISGG
jgi:hypothetical protein